MLIQKSVELSVIGAVSLLALVPWHEITFLPPAMLLSVAIGAGLAVVCIPDDRRTVRLSIVTALAGLGIGLLFADLAVEWLQVTTAASAKAIAGVLGFGGLPFAGLMLRLIDSASNNPTHWLGALVRKFIPPDANRDNQPPSGRA